MNLVFLMPTIIEEQALWSQALFKNKSDEAQSQIKSHPALEETDDTKHLDPKNSPLIQIILTVRIWSEFGFLFSLKFRFIQYFRTLSDGFADADFVFRLQWRI